MLLKITDRAEARAHLLPPRALGPYRRLGAGRLGLAGHLGLPHGGSLASAGGQLLDGAVRANSLSSRLSLPPPERATPVE